MSRCRGPQEGNGSLVDDTETLVLVSLERSRQFRSSVPDRNLQPRPRTKHASIHKVKCRWTLQGSRDPDVVDLVNHRKTETSTLSTNGRATILQLIASCRFVLTLGHVRSTFLLADREERPKGHFYVTKQKAYV